MTDISGDEYYKAHIAEEKEYVQVTAAYPIRKGETRNDGSNRPAPEDGYEIGNVFYTKAEFATATTAADDLALPSPRKNLSAEQLAGLTAVSKGDEITSLDIRTGQKLERIAEHDGFLLPSGREKVYLSNFEFSVTFNDVAKKRHTEAAPVTVILKNEHNDKLVKGILVTQATQLTQVFEQYSAPAGAILLNNGSTISSIFNLKYRLTEKWTALANVPAQMQQCAIDSQAKLKKISQELKARRAALAQ